MSKDYYKTLGVGREATDDEIKKAFRRLAHEHHPDKGGNQDKFKEINEAYQVLGDAKKRKQYDQYGTAFDQNGQGGFSGFEGFGGMGGGINMEDLGDILGNMFSGGFSSSRGGTGTKTRSKRGRDIEMNMTIDLMDAVTGTEREVELYKEIACEECDGAGKEPNTEMITCKTCGGAGQVRQSSRTIFGMMQSVVTCSDCGGLGSKPKEECKKCGGTGVAKGTKKFLVKIPAGVDDGGTMRVPGGGEAGIRGGSAGDLYINIEVRKDKRFERKGDDIFSKLKITYPFAVLGGSMTVETVDGEVELKIPAGTLPGTMLKLKCKGVPRLGKSGRGDHLVEILVDIPQKLSRRQKELLEELRWELGD
ncbi:molecular chaperone DnaJ [Candidatus Uhrbacteria bacterium]|nr:molecular chaperone DnaJ [Candidatus Uhrbacteria bacterium]